nr:hypothetical protein [uncultured Olsenella sp.]
MSATDDELFCGEIRDDAICHDHDETGELCDYEVWCEHCDQELDQDYYPTWKHCPWCGREIREGLMP